MYKAKYTVAYEVRKRIGISSTRYFESSIDAAQNHAAEEKELT